MPEQESESVAELSAALDEVFRLRRALAYEAGAPETLTRSAFAAEQGSA